MTVDLANRDREPIHLPGRIQPFGFLLGVSADDWSIVHASRNAAEWLGAGPASLIGSPLVSVFGEKAVHTIRGALQGVMIRNAPARLFGVPVGPAGTICDMVLHVSGRTVVIECEPAGGLPSHEAASAVLGMLNDLRQAATEERFYRTAAREVRALTGFDRVMIYRFDPDGSGEVIAEAARPGLESHLGLHCPASDIPLQARAFYERNWLSVIPDIDGVPVPIEPEFDAGGAPLDLSQSALRSVSPVHIEYLRDMGVRAAMSISLLKEGRLWGLIACHHYEPHHIPFARRTAAELFGQTFSLMMENRERAKELRSEARAQDLHNRLVTRMAGEGMHLSEIVESLDEFRDLLGCDGIGLRLDGRVILRGSTPSETEFAELVDALVRMGAEGVFATHRIGAILPAAAFVDRAAGMMAVSLSRPARDYLVFFRPEAASSADWAGDPEKAASAGPLGDRLTPRRSFELWKETVRGQSRPWTDFERRIAENLRVSLLEVILHMSESTMVERRRAQERQELLIAELNHRIRNVLGLIRGIISQSRGSADSIGGFTDIVSARISALARAHDQITAEPSRPISFSRLVTTEAGAYLGGKSDRVVIEGPDALIDQSAFTTIALVIHELITNSVKYGALSDRRGRVELATGFAGDGAFEIGWSEHEGPPVEPPKRRGFGSTVIERSITHDLGGTVEIDFARQGLRARLVVPADHVTRAGPGEARPASARRPLPEADGRVPASALVVEDNVIIALDAEEMLRGLGVQDVESASSVAGVLDILDRGTVQFALLDVDLGGESSFPVAERLAARGIPFVFASGYGEPIAFPAAFEHVPRLRKPYSVEQVRDVMLVAMSSVRPEGARPQTG